jgi:hypothetical protein
VAICTSVQPPVQLTGCLSNCLSVRACARVAGHLLRLLKRLCLSVRACAHVVGHLLRLLKRLRRSFKAGKRAKAINTSFALPSLRHADKAPVDDFEVGDEKEGMDEASPSALDSTLRVVPRPTDYVYPSWEEDGWRPWPIMVQVAVRPSHLRHQPISELMHVCASGFLSVSLVHIWLKLFLLPLPLPDPAASGDAGDWGLRVSGGTGHIKWIVRPFLVGSIVRQTDPAVALATLPGRWGLQLIVRRTELWSTMVAVMTA